MHLIIAITKRDCLLLFIVALLFNFFYQNQATTAVLDKKTMTHKKPPAVRH